MPVISSKFLSIDANCFSICFPLNPASTNNLVSPASIKNAFTLLPEASTLNCKLILCISRNSLSKYAKLSAHVMHSHQLNLFFYLKFLRVFLDLFFYFRSNQLFLLYSSTFLYRTFHVHLRE